MGDLQPTFEGSHSDFDIIIMSTKRRKYLIRYNFLGFIIDGGTIILTFELCVSFPHFYRPQTNLLERVLND